MVLSGGVFVALSGGVDSAVAAARLLAEGYRVTGIYMETWKDPKWLVKGQHLSDPAELAKENAEKLGVPFIKLDVRDRFYEDVVKGFTKQYLLGQTPNPCMFCNPRVKWGILQNFALEQGAEFFATGHYARIQRLESGKVRLVKGADPLKDQSYVLARLSQEQICRTLLPLGDLTKQSVRNQAKALGLPVADRKDSQDLCFLGDVDYRDFLQRYAPESLQPGEIVDMEGTVLGEHQGLAFYTVGQRRGIRIAAQEPYYVAEKEVAGNRLVVGHAHQVSKDSLNAGRVNWIAGTSPVEGDIYNVMIRYRAKPVKAALQSVTGDGFRLKFIQPQRGISPGQVAVLYRRDVCLGGGIILA